MTGRICQAYLVVMFLAAQGALAQMPGLVRTQAGLVLGSLAGPGNDIFVWRGIRYALPPVGDLRWKAPQPPARWGGIVGLVTFGPLCPQGDLLHLKDALNQRGMGLAQADMSEDCLNLNVWSGAKPGQKLPVFVWIHGGGFTGGSGRINGEPLARLGIVVVSINYRLGVLGFMAHPDLTRESPNHASGNYGLMDQIVALRWVQRNIAAFGGNPHRVTIGGSSAGGTSIGYLLASPLAKGLFQAVMLDSASRLFLPDPGLGRTLHGLTPMEQVGLQIAPHIQELRALGAAEVLTRAAQVTGELYGEGGRGRIGLKPESHVHMPDAHDRPWWAFTDGYVMPDELNLMFAAGHFNHAACLIGACKDEGLSFTGKMPDLTVEGYHDYLGKYYPAIAMKMLAMYPGTTPEGIRAAITRTITDFMFLYGSARVADYESAAGQPVYVERFVRVPPGAPGALHGADGAYFLGAVKAGEGKYDADDEKLSTGMMMLLAAFVKNPSQPPSPEWPAWTPKRRQYLEIGDQMQARPFHDEAIIDLYREQLGQ